MLASPTSVRPAAKACRLSMDRPQSPEGQVWKMERGAGPWCPMKRSSPE